MILALAVASSLVLFLCFFFFFFLRCVVVDKGERWLWPVVVVVGLADAEVFVVFFCGKCDVLFYCKEYIILLWCVYYFIVLKGKIDSLLQHGCS